MALLDRLRRKRRAEEERGRSSEVMSTGSMSVGSVMPAYGQTRTVGAERGNIIRRGRGPGVGFEAVNAARRVRDRGGVIARSVGGGLRDNVLESGTVQGVRSGYQSGRAAARDYDGGYNPAGRSYAAAQAAGGGLVEANKTLKGRLAGVAEGKLVNAPGHATANLERLASGAGGGVLSSNAPPSMVRPMTRPSMITRRSGGPVELNEFGDPDPGVERAEVKGSQSYGASRKRSGRKSWLSKKGAVTTLDVRIPPGTRTRRTANGAVYDADTGQLLIAAREFQGYKPRVPFEREHVLRQQDLE